MTKGEKDRFQKKVNIVNKKASFEFHVLNKYEAGIVLTGTEIKSIRENKVQLQQAFCVFIKEELYIKQMHISEYKQGTYNNHFPTRDRKLLLHKRELKKIKERLEEKGLTLIPLRMYTNSRGLVKVEIALAKGKKLYDKRQDIKEKDTKRDLERTKY